MVCPASAAQRPGHDLLRGDAGRPGLAPIQAGLAGGVRYMQGGSASEDAFGADPTLPSAVCIPNILRVPPLILPSHARLPRPEGHLQGTNGGVTWAGLGASTAGGLFMGIVFWAAVLASPSTAADTALREAALRQWLLIPAGASRPGCSSQTHPVHDKDLDTIACKTRQDKRSHHLYALRLWLLPPAGASMPG